MGICKCKKRTDLFCFIHKKAVCENCILQEHYTCIIKTYVDWLTDSEYEPPKCGICRGDFMGDGANVLRLTCLDMFHAECVDVHAASLPAHTAKAGYVCPTCSKPIFPNDEETPIAKHLLEHLSKSSWAKSFISGSLNSEPSTSTERPIESITEISSPPPLSSSSSSSSSTLSSRTVTTTTTEVATQNAQDTSLFGRPRKPQREHAITIDTEEEYDDKYRKRSIGVKIDTKRALILFALVVCLIMVFFLGVSLTPETEPEGV